MYIYIYTHTHIHICIYHIFFIHSSVTGHLGCFHVLPIVNSQDKSSLEGVGGRTQRWGRKCRLGPSLESLGIQSRKWVGM